MLITKDSILALEKGFSQLHKAAWQSTETFYQRFTSTVPSSTKSNLYGWMARIQAFREWVGPRVFQNLSTHAYELENRDWELSVKVPRNDLEDDNLGVYNSLMSEMGRHAGKLPDTLVLEALRNGSATTNLCFDGLPFFDTAHLLSGAAQANEGSETLTAGATGGFATVRAIMQSYVGEDGQPLGVTPNLLVTCPAFETRAKEILVATTISTGGTNVQQGQAQLLIIPELTSSDGWFMFDTSKGVMPLLLQMRRAITMQALTNLNDPNVFLNREFIWGQDGRMAVGYGPWFLAYHSTGGLGS